MWYIIESKGEVFLTHRVLILYRCMCVRGYRECSLIIIYIWIYANITEREHCLYILFSVHIYSYIPIYWVVFTQQSFLFLNRFIYMHICIMYSYIHSCSHIILREHIELGESCSDTQFSWYIHIYTCVYRGGKRAVHS